MTVHITLSGARAERFLEFKTGLAHELGYEPSNPEVLGFLMAALDNDELGTAGGGGTEA